MSMMLYSIGRVHLEVCCYCMEGFFKFQVLLGLIPLSLVDVLHVIGGGFNIYGSFTSVWFASL